MGLWGIHYRVYRVIGFPPLPMHSCSSHTVQEVKTNLEGHVITILPNLTWVLTATEKQNFISQISEGNLAILFEMLRNTLCCQQRQRIIKVFNQATLEIYVICAYIYVSSERGYSKASRGITSKEDIKPHITRGAAIYSIASQETRGVKVI